ncbi:MAG: DUF4097 family beta strand repeat protein [Spirochaetes bacterium]|nr:DUF4097 family beta strand repeat protein [Spirochaetota bacterium]
MKHMPAAALMALLVCGIAFGSGQSGTFVKDFQDVQTLELDSLYIPVQIRTTTGNQLHFEAYNIPDAVEVNFETSGNTLRVVVRKKLLAIIPPNPGSRIEIQLPANVDCILESASGSFDASGLAGQIFRVDTASGSIKCADMTVPLELETSSGSIQVQDSSLGKVLKSVSGSILLEESDGDAVISSVSGTIRVDSVRGAIKASSTSGSIRMEEVEGRLYLTTVSGSIRGEDLLLSGELKAESTSGSIELDVEQSAENFRYSAKTVSGSIRIFDTRASGSLSGGSGSITLTLATISGSIRVQ